MSAAISLARRALLLLFFVGCLASMLASGRFTVRLLVDGAVSFAFVPVVELAGFAAVWRLARRRDLPFARAADQFFAGNWPWLVWLTVVAAVMGVVPPRAQSPWIWAAIVGCAIPIAWSIRVDFAFFRVDLAQTPRGALRALFVSRGVAWGLGVTYFFGIALWPELAWLASKVGL